MNKVKLFKAATVLLAVSFLFQAVTALGMVFLSDLLMRIGIFGIFREIHEYNGFLFVALVLFHIFLNWGWVRANILRKKVKNKSV
jgi:cytochrome b subunit of formate dehydrogenase